MRRFVRKEIAPHVDEWEEAREFPRELFARCGELGLPRPQVPGGSTAARAGPTSTTRSGSRSCRAPGARAGSPPGSTHTPQIAMPPVFNFGTEEQRRRWIVPGIRGELIGALGITEPGAGSDVAGIRTFARRVAGGYVVNGSKTFITNGVRADFLVCAVQDDRGGRTPRPLLPRPGARDARLRGDEEAGEDGLALLRHRRARLHRRRGPRGEPARRGERRLLPDHGQLPVGAACRWRWPPSAGCRGSSR